MRLGEVVIYVRKEDFADALVLYRDRLGLRVLFEEDGIAGLDAGGVEVLLHDVEGGVPAPLPTFVVPDLGAAVEELRASGVEVSDVDEKEWGKIAYLADPSGNRLAIEEERRPQDRDSS